MFRELQNEAKLSFILHTKSPLFIKSEKSNVLDPTLPDMQCIKSRYKGKSTPIIPGSSIKGVLRSRYESLAILFGGRCCNVVEKQSRCKISEKKKTGREVYESMCPACKLFGSTEISSRISITDAYPEGEYAMGERMGVGINRITGAAQKGALYDFEVVEEGSFRAGITLKNYEIYQLKLLLYVLKDINDGYVTLGGATTRGNGRMEVLDLSIIFREYRKNKPGIKFNEHYQFDTYPRKQLFYEEKTMENVVLDDILEGIETEDIVVGVKGGDSNVPKTDFFER